MSSAALVQQITPELLQWIAAQAQAGHKPDAVLEAMRSSGWNDDVARGAIDHLRGGLVVELPPPTSVPEPDLTDSPWLLRTSDREVRVLASMRLPRVIVFGNLLSDEECDSIVESARERLARSVTIDNWNGDSQVSEWRTSEGMFFTRGENEVLQRVEQRIAELLGWPVERGESMQVLRYGPGAEYKPHHDYFSPLVAGVDSVNLKRGGQRVATLLMYLNTPLQGGSTIFPDVDFQVAPIKGNAVFFSYDRPHPITRTLHGGAPVISGEKWVATKWLRQDVLGPSEEHP